MKLLNFEHIKHRYEKYKNMYDDYKDLLQNTLTDIQQISFYEALNNNKILNDRVMMLYMASESEVANVTSTEEYQSSQHYITLTNIYTITQALYDRKKSFILPIPLLKELQTLNHSFQTTREALEYLIKWESG